MSDTNIDITKLLREWADGDLNARDRLIPVVLDDLRGLARSYLARERRNHTWQPTEVVNAFVERLLERRRLQWTNRKQFFKSASDLMRCILVDYARRRRAAKRGGDVPKIALEDAPTLAVLPDVDYEKLYEALDLLGHDDPHLRKLVELKFFFGLTHAEIAEQLGVSPDTIKLRWKAAKARLYRELKKD